MKIKLDILRLENSESEPYRQCVVFETDDENATVATALTEINNKGNYKDENGKTVAPIHWECSCLQKKCGACAMVINNKPQLACNARLKLYEKKGIVTVEPLKKFPVIADLAADRSIIFENLKTMKIWLESQTKVDECVSESVYDASRCLQCGCCLEVCPNFYVGSDFFGMSGTVSASKIISSAGGEQKKEIAAAYKKHSYNGCGKSLACRDVCPAGIDVERLLVNSNAAAVWGRKIGKKNKKA